MSERFRIAANHNIDRVRIAKLVRVAATKADLQLDPAIRTDVLKMIEEAVKGRIEAWKASNEDIVKSDVIQAVKPLAKDVLNEIKKKEESDEDFVVTLEGQMEIDSNDQAALKELDDKKLDIFGKIIADTLLGYIQGGAIKVGSEQEDLIFASEEEALQYLADMTGDKIIIASDRKQVTEHRFEDVGVENSQDFQGAGTAFTKWEDAFVGIGDSPWEAAEDALENAAHTWDVDNIKNEMSKEITVTEEESENGEIYQYVVLYLK